MPTPRGYQAAPQHEVIDVDLDDGTDQSFAEKTVSSSMGNRDTVVAEEDRRRLRQLRLFIIALCVLFVLGVVDSLTTKFLRKAGIAFAAWTFEEAPNSFLLFQFVIIVLIMCCLPYGPLSYLLGAIVTQLYGPVTGFFVGFFLLFSATMTAAVSCFVLSRHSFKETVQRKVKLL